MKCAVVIGIFVLTVFTNVSFLYAETVSGEIAVHVEYGKEIELCEKYKVLLQILLLSDEDDILAQLEQLREQSKVELESLVKQYMLAAEELTQLAVKTDADQAIQRTREQLSHAFRAAEKRINAVLEHYQTAIDSLIEQHTLQTLIMPVSRRIMQHASQFRNIIPGKYRIYGIMTFSTTTVRWFEPIVVKGGDCHTIYLTRENIMNPYWTELNWWSFMNLDFSKHH